MLFPYSKISCFCLKARSLCFQVCCLQPSLFKLPLLQRSSLDLDAESFLRRALILLLFARFARRQHFLKLRYFYLLFAVFCIFDFFGLFWL